MSIQIQLTNNEGYKSLHDIALDFKAPPTFTAAIDTDIALEVGKASTWTLVAPDYTPY